MTTRLDDRFATLPATTSDDDDRDTINLSDPKWMRPYLEGRPPGTWPENIRIPSPLAALDQQTRGLPRGKVVMLGSRRQAGKSDLAVSLMTHAAAAGYATMLFKPGGDRNAIGHRMISARAGVDYETVKRNARSPGNANQRIANATRELRDLSLNVQTPAQADITALRQAAEELKAGPGLDLMVVDTIQSLAASADDPELAMLRVARELPDLAKEHNITIIAVTELDPNLEQHPRPPDIDHLDEKRIGNLHWSATMILLLHRERDSWLATSDGDNELVQIAIVKHRDGPCETVNAWFNPNTARFFDCDDQQPATGG